MYDMLLKMHWRHAARSAAAAAAFAVQQSQALHKQLHCRGWGSCTRGFLLPGNTHCCGMTGQQWRALGALQKLGATGACRPGSCRGLRPRPASALDSKAPAAALLGKSLVASTVGGTALWVRRICETPCTIDRVLTQHVMQAGQACCDHIHDWDLNTAGCSIPRAEPAMMADTLKGSRGCAQLLVVCLTAGAG